MQVLCVIDSLGAGGAERSLAEMLAPLVRAGVHPTVVCLERRHEGFHEWVSRSHEVLVLPGTKDRQRVTPLRRLILRRQPDLVHSSLIRADLVSRLATRGTGIPHVSSLVNTTYDAERLLDPHVGRLGLELTRRIDGFTARHLTRRFHAITFAVAESNITALGIDRDRVEVIERGRDPERLGEPSSERRAKARASLDIAPGTAVLVHVGRQEGQKAIPDLIQAVGDLVRSGRQILLLQVGRSGNDTPQVDTAVSVEGVAENVRMLGYRDDVPDILAAGDLFVFPSLYEGLGGSMIEAMALRLPIVATRLRAIVESVEEGRNADLVSVRSPVALANAISALLDDGARLNAYGKRSRELFLERYMLDRSIERMTDFYKRALTMES